MDWEYRMLHAKQLQAQGLKQWQIAAELNVTERTVRNYLNRNFEHRVRKQRKSKLDPYKPIIAGIMNENPFFNNVVLQERLERQGYGGKISIVRDFTRGVRKQLTTQAVLRYETEPGYQAQVDWKEFGKQTLDGTERKLYAFVMTLGYSRKTFVRFTTSMKESVLLACHARAFEYFGGSVERILYDNMTTAFVRNEDGGFDPNKLLLAFANHYGFVPKRCRVRRPQTKGKVERSIGYLGNHFWQSIDGAPLSLDFLNEEVMRWLDRTDEKPIGGMNETRNERFARERGCLKALPGNEFDTREDVPVTVSRESTVRFETNTYSVDPKYIGETLVLKVDRLDMKADVYAESVPVKTLKLYDAGMRERRIDVCDREAIVKRWEADRKRRERFISAPWKKHPHCDVPFDVVVRSPSEYDHLCAITTEEAV